MFPFQELESLSMSFCTEENHIKLYKDAMACKRHRRTSKDTVPYWKLAPSEMTHLPAPLTCELLIKQGVTDFKLILCNV